MATTSSQDPTTTTAAPGDRLTDRKRRVIVEAATTAFLRSGYRGTSMDEIAALAGVSKRTVYHHFADKESLFSQVVIATVNEASDPVHQAVLDLDDTGDVDADLRGLARRQLGLVMQPRILQLRRLVIAEAARFPHLGRIFYEQGPGRTITALAATFEHLAARRVLDIDDPFVAATQFNWLIMSAALNQAMLLGNDSAPDPADLDRWTDDGVRTFLAAFRNNDRPPRA